MYKILRVVFCLLAVACAAVTIFIFIYFGMWGFVPLGLGVIFALLMFASKNRQESDELKKNPPPPTVDFITVRLIKD